MKYLVELQFDHAVHFGSSVAGFGIEEVDETCHSDTLFSSIINQITAIEHLIPDFNLKNFIDKFNSFPPPFRISSFGVVKGTDYFLPKPLIDPAIIISDPSLNEYKKEFKNLKWIHLEDFHKWQNNLLTSEDIKGYFVSYSKGSPLKAPSFFKTLTKVQHSQDRETDATQIYHTGQLFYGEDVYPFFLIDFNSEMLSWEWFMETLRLLGMAGLGGRRSSGYGKFGLRYEPILIGGNESEWPKKVCESTQHKKAIRLWDNVLNYQSEGCYLFSLFSPKTVSVSDYLAYQLLIRKGWFFSNSSFYQMKRKTVYMFSEGSLFKKFMEGKLLNISPKELPESHHEIYRYGLPFTIPFSI
jgi:CRISPR-associated protein Csm4